MEVKFFNIWYILFLLFAIGLNLGIYFLLKNKSDKTKKNILTIILFFNLALHFIKLLFPSYSTNADIALRDSWFINICAVSVLAFPFIFISKSKTLKDFMFYLGVISGVLALFYPTEALGKSILTFDLWRFYICHIIILTVPLQMVLFKVHSLDYKRIWKMPFCTCAVLLFIICNQVLQAELGFIGERNTNFLGIAYKNPSLIWGPGSEADGIAKVFSIFTPEFMKTVPFGDYAGQTKYWPFFWMLPSIFIYFITLPFLLCLPWEAKNIKNDLKLFFSKFKKENKC